MKGQVPRPTCTESPDLGFECECSERYCVVMNGSACTTQASGILNTAWRLLKAARYPHDFTGLLE